jgi:LysR family transcriptional regulator, glycine cleavage system transcriptional activator
MRSLRDINLNSLRIAESAARNGSFVLAAEEQMITPSAVSQRIKSLEEQLRFKIFDRKNNSIQITPEGEFFILQVKEALDRILSASQRSSRRDKELTLNIRSLPTFTMRWLLPRLSGFQRKFPNIYISLSNSYNMVDFATEDIDLSIWYGNGTFSDVDHIPLFREDLTPVCSPGYWSWVKQEYGVSEPSTDALRQCTLINSGTCVLNWKSWLDFVGAPDIYDEAPKIELDSCMLTFEAAAAGVGVAVANRAYVFEDLKSGKLIAPFQVQHPNRNGWYLLNAKDNTLHAPSVAFKRWISRESEKSEIAVQQMDGQLGG